MKKLKVIDFILIAIISVMLTCGIVWAAELFWMSGDLTGGGTGALDKPTGIGDKDAAIVLLNADHGTYPAFGAGYSCNINGAGTEVAPWLIKTGDGGDSDWNMVKWWGKGLATGNGATGPGFVEFYEDTDNGTNKVTLIGPASTADVTITLPAATDTLVGKATTDTLTNKTIDADGAGNVITNIESADIKDGTITASDIAVTGAFPFTGLLSGGVVTKVEATGTYTIGTTNAAECYGGVIYATVTGDITACDNLAAGMAFTLIVVGDIQVDLDVQPDDLMILDGTALNDGDKAVNPPASQAGSLIVCTYYDATGWICLSGSTAGTKWSDGG